MNNNYNKKKVLISGIAEEKVQSGVKEKDF